METVDPAGLDPFDMPVILVGSQGTFAWGRSTPPAVDNSIAHETVAVTFSRSLAVRAKVEAIGKALRECHFGRNDDGPSACYGQRQP